MGREDREDREDRTARAYAERANEHIRHAERYNRDGNVKKALAHFGRALEYDNRARSAFGVRPYGTLLQTEKGVLDGLPAEYIRMPHEGRVALFPIPTIGVGWKITKSHLAWHELKYTSDPIAIDPKVDLDRDTQTEIGTSVNTLTDASHDWIKQEAVSTLGGVERRYTVISWIPYPRYSQYKREFFMLRTA
jgi:hypothetical protein